MSSLTISPTEMAIQVGIGRGTWRDECPPSPAPSLPPPYDYEEVPAGWIKVLDPQSNRYFYIDTLAKPPVPIWVHPFLHPQFLNSVGITPDEIPDDLDLMPHAGPEQVGHSLSPTTSSIASEDHQQRQQPSGSFLKGIREKIKESQEARATANANFIRKRFRMKQLFYIEARKAILTSRVSRGDWHYGDIELVPPGRYEYGGPGYLEGNPATAFVRKVFGAFSRGNDDSDPPPS